MAVSIEIDVRVEKMRQRLQKIPGMTEDAIEEAVKQAGKAWRRGDRLAAQVERASRRRASDLADSLQKNYEHAFRSGNALLGSFMGDIEDGIELFGGLGKSVAMMGPHAIAAAAALAALTAGLVAAGATVIGIAAAVHQVQELTKANEKYVGILGLQREGNEQAIQASKDMHATLELVGVMFREIGIRIAQDFGPQIQYATEITAGIVQSAFDLLNQLPAGYMSFTGIIKKAANFFARSMMAAPYLFLQGLKTIYNGIATLAEMVLGEGNVLTSTIHAVTGTLDSLDQGLTDLIDGAVDYAVGGLSDSLAPALESTRESGRRLLDNTMANNKAHKEAAEAAEKHAAAVSKVAESRRKLSAAIRDQAREQAQSRLDLVDAMEREIQKRQEASGDTEIDRIRGQMQALREATAGLRLDVRAGFLAASEAQELAMRAGEIQIQLAQDLALRETEIERVAAEKRREIRAKEMADREAQNEKRRDNAIKFSETVTGGFMDIAEAAGASSDAIAAAKLLETIAYQAVAVARAFADGGPFVGPIAAATALGTIGAQIAALASASGQAAPTSAGASSRAVSTPEQVRTERGRDVSAAPLVVVNEYRGRVFDEQLRDSQRRRGSPLRDSRARRRRRNG